MFSEGHWMGMGSGLMWLFWLATAAVVFLLLNMFLRSFDGRPRPEQSPLEILKQRYARGEIDREEFEQKKRDLNDA